MSQIDQQLSHLTSYERALAQAYMDRADAIVDVSAAIVAGVRKLGRAIAAPFIARFRAYSERRTRRWPHAKVDAGTPEFPSIGLQH